MFRRVFHTLLYLLWFCFLAAFCTLHRQIVSTIVGWPYCYPSANKSYSYHSIKHGQPASWTEVGDTCKTVSKNDPWYLVQHEIK